MKVLMTADTIGGVWTFAMSLCAALQPCSVSVVLASMGRFPSPEQRRQAARLTHVQLIDSAYRLCWMPHAWNDVEQAGDWLLALEREHRPDIVHLNDLAHGGLDWHVPVLLTGHSCVLSWWQAVRRQAAPTAEWRRYRSIVRSSVQRASLVVAPTSAMLDCLLRYYGPARASSFIHNGRDFPRLPLTWEMKIKVAEPMIFTAGRLWDAAKNIKALMSVAGQLPWPVYVAGEQAGPGGLRMVPEGIHCLGLLAESDLQRWLARASIYVAPASYEPFGLSVLEAARAGCALVLGDIPSLREVWADAADYVEPDNHAALRQIILRLVQQPARLREMAERAGQRALRYSARNMAAGYMHGYELLHCAHALSQRTEPKRTEPKRTEQTNCVAGALQ